MKIGPSSSDGLRADGKAVGAERSTVVRPGAGTDPLSGARPVERVSLSAAPVLAGTISATPFDERKVEEVRRAIAEGRFPVDARRVAQELIAEAREFLGIAQRDAR
jgi:negative regulator of flagellin synthesis FlgM